MNGKKILDAASVLDASPNKPENPAVARAPDLGDLSDLPEELLRELRTTRMDELDDRIVAILTESGSALNIDQILIGLYRKFNAIHKRAFLMNKLYRLSLKGPINHAGSGTYARPGLRKAKGAP